MVITPMQILEMSAKAYNTPRTSTSTQSNHTSPEVVGNLIDSIFQNSLGMNATDAQKKRYTAEYQKMLDKGSVTTSTTVGKNTTSSTTPGFSQQDVQAKLENTLKTSPEYATDLKERQTLDFNSAINKLMSRSI